VALATRDALHEIDLTLTGGRDGPQALWRVDGFARPFEPEGAAWQDSVLALLADGSQMSIALLSAEQRARMTAALDSARARLRELAARRADAERLAGELNAVARAQDAQAVELRAVVRDTLRIRLQEVGDQTRALAEARAELQRLTRDLDRIRDVAINEAIAARGAALAESSANWQGLITDLRELQEALLRQSQATRLLDGSQRALLRGMSEGMGGQARREELEARLRRLQEAIRRIP
jgi:hypothetical protein